MMQEEGIKSLISYKCLCRQPIGLVKTAGQKCVNQKNITCSFNKIRLSSKCRQSQRTLIIHHYLLPPCTENCILYTATSLDPADQGRWLRTYCWILLQALCPPQHLLNTPFLMDECVQMLQLTTGLLLQQLSLAVDNTKNQQGKQHGGQSTTDDCGQGYVPWAGHHRGQRHQVHTPAACKQCGGISM